MSFDLLGVVLARVHGGEFVRVHVEVGMLRALGPVEHHLAYFLEMVADVSERKHRVSQQHAVVRWPCVCVAFREGPGMTDGEPPDARRSVELEFERAIRGADQRDLLAPQPGLGPGRAGRGRLDPSACVAPHDASLALRSGPRQPDQDLGVFVPPVVPRCEARDLAGRLELNRNIGPGTGRSGLGLWPRVLSFGEEA